MNREQQDFRQRPAQRTRGTEPGSRDIRNPREARSRDIRGPQDPRRKSPRQEPSDRMRQGRG